MGQINWGRMFLCGIVAGLVWILLSIVVMTFLGRDFQDAMPNFRTGAPRGGLVALSFALNLAGGIWAMWLYAAIRPRYGPGPKTAVVAGFGFWFIATVVDAHWVTMGFVQPKIVLVPLAATLPALIVAVLVGARYYEEPTPAAAAKSASSS